MGLLLISWAAGMFSGLFLQPNGVRHQTSEEPSTMTPKSTKRPLTGLYLRNLGASVLGIFSVAVLNLFTPLRLFDVQKAVSFVVGEGGWVLFILFHPAVIFIAMVVQHVIQRPISAALSPIGTGGSLETMEKARTRLVNLPLLIGSASLGLWIILPIFMVTFFCLVTQMPIKTAVLFFFRAVMIGMIASATAFFLVEDFARTRLIPILFPKGKLAATPGTFKIPILRRIRVLYSAGTVIPMIILVGTLAFVVWELEGMSPSMALLGREVFWFCAVLCGLFVLLALRLNLLVGKSLSVPLGNMMNAVERIREGQLGTRISVLSNDEIGVLCDAGNEMISALVERERIRDTFGKYVSPEIRDQILAGRIPVNGTRAEATLLFTDLRDFTPYVEANDAEEVIKSMRAYFTAMQKTIKRHSGLVLQYVGDEIEAVFGVPIAYPGHAENAVQAALEMRIRLKELNRERIEAGKIPFRHGIGIHTGEVLVGNTGSEDRLSYSLIGDTVNLASRIQGLTRELSCDILVSESTAECIDRSYGFKKRPPQRVKGYSQPISVLEI
jgi:class 3 adenylate cyclase